MTRRKPGCIRTDREGQTLPVVAVMMVGLLAVMALAIDLGMAYTARSEAQRVADSAALAGASAFLDYVDPNQAVVDAEDRAREYAALNTVRNRDVHPDDDVEVVVLPNQERVRVWVTRAGLPAWFSRLLGRTDLTVRAMAAAEARSAGAARCVKPLAIPDRWEEKSTDPVEDFDGDQIMDFDNNIPCNGQACNVNEVWTFEPGVDEYRPLHQIGAEPAWHDPSQATSWGSTWLNGDNKDAGARILLTPQQAKGTGTSGWYQYWKMPGSSGASDLGDAIAGCIEPGSLTIGATVDADPQTGNIGNPVYKAFEQLWTGDDGDPDIQWDAVNNVPHYPNDPTRSIWDSPRVFTVLLVHPADIQSGGSHTMRVVDFATVFLEVPTEHYGDQGGNNFKSPIWGRLFHYGGGTEGPVSGSLQKYLRLVE